MRFDDWPDADRQMWCQLTASGNPLDEAGGLSHLRETTKASLMARYARWLKWLAANDPVALDEVPARRATLARLQAWVQSMAHTRPMSQLACIDGVLRILTEAAPEADWTGQYRLRRLLKRLAGHGDPSRKAGRILSSKVLLDTALKLAGPGADEATTPLEAAKRRRDGAMLALLTMIPLRRRTLVGLTIGESVLTSGRDLIIALSGEITKNGLSWEAPVPDLIAPVIKRYIAEVRPYLMRRSRLRHSAFWVDDRGRPYTEHYFGLRIATVTKRLTGRRIPPHFFRDAAATTLVRLSPESARLVRPLLGHAGFGTAERHYIHAQTIEAGRNYAAVIEALRKGQA